jgi:hypothetical protein
MRQFFIISNLKLKQPYMKQLISIIILNVFFCIYATAQTPAKAIFFELGGPGVASINYDMRFTKSEKGIGGRVGIGGFSLGTSGDRVSAIFIPLGVNYLLGKDEKHYFELGGGVTPVFIKDDFSSNSETFKSTFGHLNFGYRLQPKEGGFFFRASINPVFGKGFFTPYYGGVSFGYKF